MTELKYARDQGFARLCVLSSSRTVRTRYLRRNANPEHHIDARRLIADPVFVSFPGQRTSDGDALRIQSQRVDASRSYWSAVGVETVAQDQETVRLQVCCLHGHYRGMVWIYLLTPKSEPDLTASSPGIGAFPGLPGRFATLPASFVSLWMLLRIRGFCVFEFGNSAQHQLVGDLMSFFQYPESISG